MGDVRAGGAERTLRIASPWGDEILAELPLTDGAAATSGVTRRGWHLIDPEHRTARPHGHRPGHRARAHGARGGGPREGRAARRPGGGARPPPPRRPARARRRRGRVGMTPVWTTSRAAGLAALMTSSLAISCGLLMALKIPALRRRAPELRAAHQALANATFALIGVHAVSLLLRPGAAPRPGRAARPLRRPLPPGGHRPRADRRLRHVRAGRDVLRPPAPRHPALALGAPLAAALLAARRGPRPAGRHRRDDDVGAGRARAAGGRGRGAADDAAPDRGGRGRSRSDRGGRAGP